MKKIILLLTVTTFTSASFAQMDFNYGVKAGTNISTLTAGSTDGTVSVSTAYKAGLYAGAFAEMGIGKDMSISAELAFSQMGGKADVLAAGVKVGTQTANLNYIPLSVFFNYGIPNVKGLSVFAGPQISFLASLKATTTLTIAGVTETETSTDKKDTKSTDFAAVAGVQYKLSSIPVMFSARYQYGFSTISKVDGDKVVNSGVTVTVGYAFGGKK